MNYIYDNANNRNRIGVITYSNDTESKYTRVIPEFKFKDGTTFKQLISDFLESPSTDDYWLSYENIEYTYNGREPKPKNEVVSEVTKRLYTKLDMQPFKDLINKYGLANNNYTDIMLDAMVGAFAEEMLDWHVWTANSLDTRHMKHVGVNIDQTECVTTKDIKKTRDIVFRVFEGAFTSTYNELYPYFKARREYYDIYYIRFFNNAEVHVYVFDSLVVNDWASSILPYFDEMLKLIIDCPMAQQRSARSIDNSWIIDVAMQYRSEARQRLGLEPKREENEEVSDNDD